MITSPTSSVTLTSSEPGASADTPGGASTQRHPYVAELNPRPQLPVPVAAPQGQLPSNWAATIRLPAWCDPAEFEAWVRRWTDRGFDLRNMEFIGRHANSLAKGIRAAIALQQLLIEHEGWPTAG